MLLQKLEQQSLIHPPSWLAQNTMYLAQMGSVAYGVSGESSDIDVYGFTIPPKDMVFPHLAGQIEGFGRQKQRFDVWQQHHVKTLDGTREYDFAIYSIVRFFHLVMENNPNMIDALFVPRRCILHSTQISELVREHRRKFLHKGSWHKYRGYAYAQMSKIKNGNGKENSKRALDVQTHGFDTKFAYHVVRLILQAEQVMIEHDLDLERNSEFLKAIRRGEMSLAEIEKWFSAKEIELEGLYTKSALQHSPDEDFIKGILVSSLEMHYGNLSNAISKNVAPDMILRDLQDLVNKYKG